MNLTSIKPHSYHTLDAWRGIASLWVVMFHMSQVIIVSYPVLSTSPLYLFSLRGSLGVQMFFVISGYCIANAACKAFTREQGLTAFTMARLRRIFPPYWFAVALSGSLSIVASLLVSSHHLKSSVMAEHRILQQTTLYHFSNLTLSQGITHQPFLLPQAWTLCYELAFYLFVGISLAGAYLTLGRLAILPFLHTLTCVVLSLLIAAPHYVMYPFDLWPQFGLGILAYDVLKHPESQKPKTWLAAASLLLLGLAGVHNDSIGMMGEPIRQSFLFCFFFTGAIVMLHRYDEHVRQILPIRLLSTVGSFSYSLYLTHTFSIGLINQVIKALHLPIFVHYPVFVLFLILSVGFARFFFQFCERPFIGTPKKPDSKLQPQIEAILADQ